MVLSVQRKCCWPDLEVGWASETFAVMFGLGLSQAGPSEQWEIGNGHFLHTQLSFRGTSEKPRQRLSETGLGLELGLGTTI